MTRISISGTGFIGTGLALALSRHTQFSVTSILTRRPPTHVTHPFPNLLTNDVQSCLAHCDILVECSGDVLHATNVIDAAHARKIPVVTMNAEFHVTVGSAFIDSGYLTEAEGDQPGCIAALHQRVTSMGFQPVVLGNVKGFLNHTPSLDEMQKWSAKQGISLSQVTAFTDGSKVQIEQALVANGLGCTILQAGLRGPQSDNLEATARELAQLADESANGPISDYVLNAGGPAGVFIVARHDQEQQKFLEYLKLGSGPYYFLLQPFHLCHLEIIRTLQSVSRGDVPLLNNSHKPRVGIIAIAKRNLPAGSQIERALGGFDFRGEAVAFAEHQTYVPIGLLQHCILQSHVTAGEPLRWNQVTLPESLALARFKQLIMDTLH